MAYTKIIEKERERERKKIDLIIFSDFLGFLKNLSKFFKFFSKFLSFSLFKDSKIFFLQKRLRWLPIDGCYIIKKFFFVSNIILNPLEDK